jgi:hypothetical protein
MQRLTFFVLDSHWLVAYVHNAKQLLAESKEGEHRNAKVELFLFLTLAGCLPTFITQSSCWLTPRRVSMMQNI